MEHAWPEAGILAHPWHLLESADMCTCCFEQTSLLGSTSERSSCSLKRSSKLLTGQFQQQLLHA